MLRAGNILSMLGVRALLVGMLFFAIMASFAFIKLPPDLVGPFIRAAFPRYYAFIVGAAGLGALGYLLRGQRVSAIVLLLIVGVTLWMWFWLIPHLNAWREAGDAAVFARGHRLAVWVNGVEFLSALVLLIRAAI